MGRSDRSSYIRDRSRLRSRPDSGTDHYYNRSSDVRSSLNLRSLNRQPRSNAPPCLLSPSLTINRTKHLRFRIPLRRPLHTHSPDPHRFRLSKRPSIPQPQRNHQWRADIISTYPPLASPTAQTQPPLLFTRAIIPFKYTAPVADG